MGGFAIDATIGNIDFYRGELRGANQAWSRAAQRASQQQLRDTAGSFYAFMSLNNALASNCNLAGDYARRGLALDRSVATVPHAALALALCADSAGIQEMQKLAASLPLNTLVNDVYSPQVKAAAALAKHHPETVAELLTSAGPYLLVSKASQLLGRASLDTSQWQQAVNDFSTGLRYRGIALQQITLGNPQGPDYTFSLLGTARAQSHLDKAAAVHSYQQLLDIWKEADADFIPAQEAKHELSALQQ